MIRLRPLQASERIDLAAWPELAAELLRRGLDTSPHPGETPDEFENRASTGLMALYRDTRDPRSFEALYAFAGPGVHRWIKSLLGRELAQLDPAELLQDTFVNVYRYPSAFRENHRGSFRVWVRTIAGNVVRRAAARARAAPQELLEETADIEDHGRGPVEAIADEEQELRLRQAWVLLLWYYAQAWKELSQRDRRTLHLVEVEGLSYQEAGQILSVGRSNMKMIVFRSRKRIARHMRAAMSGASLRTTPRTSAPELVA